MIDMDTRRQVHFGVIRAPIALPVSWLVGALSSVKYWRITPAAASAAPAVEVGVGVTDGLVDGVRPGRATGLSPELQPAAKTAASAPASATPRPRTNTAKE